MLNFLIKKFAAQGLAGMVPPSTHTILTCQSPDHPVGDPGGIGTMVCAVLLGCEELPSLCCVVHKPGFPSCASHPTAHPPR